VQGRTAQDDNIKKGISLLINKEDSSDKELASDDKYESEEDVSVTSEDKCLDKQNKNDNAPDNDEEAEDESREDSVIFSEDDSEVFAFVQDVTCNMNDKAGIPDSWILLDGQSTVDVFKKVLKNIHHARKALSLYCKARVTTVNKLGNLPGCGRIWFYEYGIANILSLNNLKKKYHVTYESTACDCFEVHKLDCTKCVFKPSKKGLFYSSANNDVVLVTTVEYKTNKYTVREF